MGWRGADRLTLLCVGTVTGAYWSGEGVAKRIARAYGLAGSSGKEGDGEREEDDKA